MKALAHQKSIAVFLFSIGVVGLIFFQSCTNDASFDSDPSQGQVATPVDGDSQNFNSPASGNSDIIIQINEAPVDGTSDENVVIDYEVSSPSGDITNVDCVINGQGVDCDPIDRIVIPPTGTGEQTITITATNSNGTTVTETITWTIYDRIVERIKDFDVTVAGDQVDIIINIDNSGSMEYEQTSMAARIANFMEPFAGLDYHIAITTTSPIGAEVGGVFVWAPSLDYVDGQFTELDNSGTFCIKASQHSVQQSQAFIESNVIRSLNLLDSNGNILVDGNGNTWPEGNGFERGIYTTRRAFERSLAGQQNDNSCIRDGSVPKHVILISDEDETIYEEDANSNPIIDPNTNQPRPLVDIQRSSGDGLRSYVAAQYGADTVFKFHSIIVNPLNQEGINCLNGHGRSLGVEYARLSQDSGGYIGSVCAADYSAQLGEIGRIISDSSLTEALECVAVPDQNGNFGSVNNRNGNTVGGEVNVPYVFNGDKVDFERLLPQGSYRITYYCYE
jgi:hypothetical protein